MGVSSYIYVYIYIYIYSAKLALMLLQKCFAEALLQHAGEAASGGSSAADSARLGREPRRWPNGDMLHAQCEDCLGHKNHKNGIVFLCFA